MNTMGKIEREKEAMEIPEKGRGEVQEEWDRVQAGIGSGALSSRQAERDGRWSRRGARDRRGTESWRVRGKETRRRRHSRDDRTAAMSTQSERGRRRTEREKERVYIIERVLTAGELQKTDVEYSREEGVAVGCVAYRNWSCRRRGK
jgi:hypothetical protein